MREKLSPTRSPKTTNRSPTEFEERVYTLLKSIPKGKVTTYQALANALGHKGAQAIGNACNRNPSAPLVPCHRVVRSNGEIGGYAYGSEQKRKLLEEEGIRLRDDGTVKMEDHFYEVPIPL